MRTVIFSMSVSLDGYIVGRDGDIAWAAPDVELFQFHNEQTREIDVHLTGRGLYEDMLPWETAELTLTDPLMLEFAQIWKAIPKVVFSTTLHEVVGNAQLATADPATEVARAKEQPGEGVVSVGGANFAAALIKLDLIDEYRLFVNPVVLGGGTAYFPEMGKPVSLELIEKQTFGSRVVYLRYLRR